MRGFKIEAKIDSSPSSPTIAGEIQVVVAAYFDTTISVTYRLIVGIPGKFCSADLPLTTDQLMILAAAPLGAEHWIPAGDQPSTINTQLDWCKITDLPFGEDGTVLDSPMTLAGKNDVILDAMARYKAFLTKGIPGDASGKYDTNYVVVDIWEDIAHTVCDCGAFESLDAATKISHIESRHQSELMGLLTLYPYEWRYRDPRFFERTCGENLALDIDDLVLVSDNSSLILGTYAVRGHEGPTDWIGLRCERELDHVAWPELLHLLDIALAKMHTAKSAFYSLQVSQIALGRPLKYKNVIRESSLLTLRISRLLMDMDAVDFSRYASHKIMYRRIEERLGVREELSALLGALAQIDAAVKNIDSIEELVRSRAVRMLLIFITIASVFQVIFEETSIPVLRRMATREIAEAVGTMVISSVAIGLILIVLVGVLGVVARSLVSLVRRCSR